jgi:EAL domain-containing protein (putative c-di-GMP-specific phosphodiesterase class I)
MKDDGDANIVSTIITMGHNLSLNVVAEGVETDEQLAFLRDKGCVEVQGFYYSRPVPAAEFEDFVLRHRS